VTSLNAATGTFVIATKKVRGFTPSQTTVNVTTSGSTVFLTDGGRTKTQAEFFALLATTPIAEVKGTYNAATNTLTATKVKVEDESNDGQFEDGHHRNGDDHNDDGKVDGGDDDHGSGGHGNGGGNG
jgi:hypothetical protein